MCAPNISWVITKIFFVVYLKCNFNCALYFYLLNLATLCQALLQSNTRKQRENRNKFYSRRVYGQKNQSACLF